MSKKDNQYALKAHRHEIVESLLIFGIVAFIFCFIIIDGLDKLENDSNIPKGYTEVCLEHEQITELMYNVSCMSVHERTFCNISKCWSDYNTHITYSIKKYKECDYFDRFINATPIEVIVNGSCIEHGLRRYG